ncbi:MAG: CPBP family intramembrane metalloprotease [Bacteroidales bacterium]|nr:CPBP family intramembrane metalloprotease [Bacteroidales bacterium]
MYQTERFLENKSPFLQLLVLIILILFSTFLIFFLGVLIALPFFGMNVLDLLTEASNMNSPNDVALLKYFQVVSQIGMFIIPSVIFAVLVSGKAIRYLGLNNFPTGLTTASAMLLIFTILPSINWLAEINQALTLPEWMSAIEGWMRESEDSAARLTEMFLKTETFSGLLLNLLMVAVFAAVGEELLFRGIILRILRNWIQNYHVAIWISAFLFSMMHLQFFGFLPRLLLGALFGYLMVWSGSLWLPVFAHFLNNAGAVLVFYFYNMEVIDTPVESFGTLQNGLLFLVSILVSAALLVIIYFKNRKIAHAPNNF